MKEYLSQTLKRSSSLLASLFLVFQMTLPLTASAGHLPDFPDTDNNGETQNVSYWCGEYITSDGGVKFEGTDEDKEPINDTNDDITVTYSPSGDDDTIEKTSVTVTSENPDKEIVLVVVKAGSDGGDDDHGNNIYDGPSFENLTAPDNKGISHVIVCYDVDEEPETGSITIKKDAVPDSSQAFHFSTTGLSTDGTGFDLVDDSTTGLPERVFSDLAAGSYIVSEDTVNDWDFDAVSCSQGSNVVKTGSSVTITLAAGQDVTCTFTNREAPSVDNCEWLNNRTGAPVSQNDCFDASVQAVCSPNGGAILTGTLTGGVTNKPTWIYKIYWSETQPSGTAADWLTNGNELPKTFDEDYSGGEVTIWWWVQGTENGALAGSGVPTRPGDSNANATGGQMLVIDTDCKAPEEPKGSITIIKDAKPDDEQDFAFTSTGQGVNNFTLDDDGDANDGTSNTITFSDLSDGTYTFSEAEVSGWNFVEVKCEGLDEEDWEDDNSTRSVEVELDGEDVTCVFTNEEQGGGNGGSTKGSITGHKVEDKDGDQQWDQDEEALPGWTINLYTCTDNQILSRLSLNPTCDNATIFKSTTTDANGAFAFNDLDLGTYMVCEVQQAGWEQTFPSDNNGCHIIDVNSSEPCIANFGNKEKPGQVLGETTTTPPQVLATTGTPLLQGLLVGLTILGFAGATSYFTMRKQYNY